MENKKYYIYILASNHTGTLYVGVTNDLMRRVDEHKSKINESFTKKYDVSRLVYYEETDNIESAIKREKQLKNWKRDWKIALIEKDNPHWDDLFYKMDPGSSPGRQGGES